MGGNDLARAAATLERVEDLTELWGAILAALRPHGIEHAIYLTTAPDGSDAFLLTTLPALYDRLPPPEDPFLRHCCDSYEVNLTGSAFSAEHDMLTPEAAAFVEEAARGGFRSGLGIPVRLVGSRRHGGFNLGTSLDRARFEERVLPHADAMRAFCLIAHRCIEKAAAAAALGVLTTREREVALLLAEGRSRKECARICDLSPHTIAEYVKSAYRKLGVRDRMALARRLGG
ncbi:autoinducer binding domain-containing protein [Hasllibacter halocynthiae]|uniref:Autoinducer binding domain-containing protein n=1 Tax=Hasllibacter halocynthiae TaxID=595589 RepID=A0A2T0X3A8_9RHOB|nr:LuxR family transcriptional regulator [Hasllibacter halocynthiae]PRY93420.1 autoinducer binding domain-containing protein [Hasllibacter halocynthiae]